MSRIVLFLASLVIPVIASSLNSSNSKSPGAGTALPPPMTLSYPSPVCVSANPVNPSTTNYPGGGTFFATSGLFINSQTGVITPSLSSPGNYTVTLFVPNTTPVTALVTIVAGPAINITGASSVCAGSQVVLTASAPGGVSFNWSNGANGPSVMLTPTANMTISVFVTNSFGCSATKNHIITFKPLPQVFVPTASVCAGSTVALTAFATPSDNVVYTWNPGGMVGPTVVVSPAQTQVYTIYANAAGCVGNTSQLVTVSPTTTRSTVFGYITPLCTNSGDPFPMHAPGFATGGVYYTDDPDIKINATTGQVALPGVPAGEHQISYSIAAVGCTLSSTHQAVLLINQGGALSSSFSEVTIEEGTSVELDVTGGSAYNWSPPDYLTCFDCDRPVATPVMTTRYCVNDVNDGCITKSCTDVIVVCVNNGLFEVPNAFTPNGDKNNDCFYIKGWSYCVSDFKIMIYDRWGQKVYEATDPDFCWDGNFNGNPLVSGVYVYAITASINRNPISTKKGNITLIR